MHGSILYVTILLVVMLWSLCGFAGAEKELRDESAMYLRGLPGVRVQVSTATSDKGYSTLNKERIQTDVELRLRLAGIRVLTEKEWKETRGAPSLWILVAAVTRNENPNIYVYSIEVLLMELVRPERRIGGDPVFAATWSAPQTAPGLISIDYLPAIRDQVLDKVDDFINAFLKANPLTPPSGKRN